MEISFTRVALLAAALFFVGCDQKPQPAKTHATEVTVLEGKTMGTFWRASIPGIDAKRSAELKEKIQTQLDADDQLLSTYKKDSALMRFNDSQSLSPWPVSEAMADIVTTSLRIGARTDGAMDITVGPLVNLWGFGPEQQPVQIPSQEQIDAMKAKTGLQHLTVINQSHQQYLQKDLPDLYVDLSTVGEGYAADHLARLMEQEGISRYLVSVGGALNSRGMNGEGQPWRVAIQKPTDKENAVQAVVDINGHGISTSGSYRNYYETGRQTSFPCYRSANRASHRTQSGIRDGDCSDGAGSRCLGYWLDGTRAGESQRGCSPGRAGGLYDHQRRR